MKLTQKLAVATASIALSFAGVGAKPVQALTLFFGPYAPSNWTLTNTNADGSVNTSSAPTSITLTGGNNGSFSSGTTNYTTQALSSGLVSFNWNYSTPDWFASADPFNFVLNGSATSIFDNSNDTTGSGTFSQAVTAGDVFGFQVATSDNNGGAGSITISNYPSQGVPEPSNILGLLIMTGSGIMMIKKFRSQVRVVSRL